MLISLTPSQVMAVRDILVDHLTRPNHTEVFVDIVNNVETTPADLLAVFLNLHPSEDPTGTVQRRHDDYIKRATCGQILDLIAMTFIADVHSTIPFDRRIVERTIALAKNQPQ